MTPVTPVPQVVLVLSERAAQALEAKLLGSPLNTAQAALLQGVAEEVGSQLTAVVESHAEAVALTREQKQAAFEKAIPPHTRIDPTAVAQAMAKAGAKALKAG